jgi:hypothetical protein
MKFFNVVITILAVMIIYTIFTYDFSNSHVKHTPLHHIVVIPYNVTHKPKLPSKRYDEVLVIINQSSFLYENLDEIRKEYEFKIDNRDLTKDDLLEIAKQMVPKDTEMELYIF